jgi:hypothetical protein
MVVFAFFVSVVFAVLSRDEPRAQLAFAARLFLTFIGAAIAIGWALYPLPL